MRQIAIMKIICCDIGCEVFYSIPKSECLQIIGKKGGKTLSDKEKMSIFVALLFLCVRKH